MNTGNWLALDTSTAGMTIAVINGKDVLGENSIRADRNHSTILLPTIKQLMQSLNMWMGDLDGIAAGQGPGSYTGVRIGVTVAKTMAWALNIPLIGVSSLEALAFGALNHHQDGQKKWIVPLINARRNQVFTSIYESFGNGTHWRCISTDAIRLMNDWTDDLAQLASGMQTSKDGKLIEQPDSIIFVGEVGPFGEFVDELSKHVVCKVKAEELEISAREVGFLALRQWLEGVRQDVHRFVPNYAQLTEAEKNLSGNLSGN